MKRAKLEGRAALLATLTEAQFRRQVIQWAKREGWLVSSMHDSRQQTWGTDRGIPDLIMAKGGRLVFAELKRVGGRLSAHQEKWIDHLDYAEVEVYIWKPTDEESIKRVLDGSAVFGPLAAGQPNAGETDRYDCGRNGTPRCPTWPACEHGDLPFAPLEREGIA